jgi:transposase
MSLAELVITSVMVEGRSKSEVARDYKISRYWVQQLVQRYESEGGRPRSERRSGLGPSARTTTATNSQTSNVACH